MAQIIARQYDLDGILENLPLHECIAFDLETTTLRPHEHRAEIFGMSFATKTDQIYLDFNDYDGRKPYLLPSWHKLKDLFSDPRRHWCAHNAKFDLGWLSLYDIEVAGSVWCTQTMARVERNDHMAYSLDACLSRQGKSKDGAVKEWMDAHKAFTVVEIEGKKTKIKNYHFDRVPLEIMAPYAMQDAAGCRSLFEQQNRTFQDIERQKTRPIFPLVKLETRVTKIVTKMERTGIRVDRTYCKDAAEFERKRLAQAESEFVALSGTPFIDSAKSLGPVFSAHGIAAGRTEKGNASFTNAVLQQHRAHPIVSALLTYRDAKKRLGTYWSSFLYHSQWDGRIHCSLNPAGTGTGRFSSSDPNLQNLTDDEAEAGVAAVLFPIRRAFIPDEGKILWSADYRQMEYYLMLEYAQEMGVIAEVLAGKDLHQACADLMGVDRKTAKTINFLLLYGGGNQILADTLGVGVERAQELKRIYFEALPAVKSFIQGVVETAKTRGYIFNWQGRRSYFPDPAFAYKAPNYLIQGGGADIVRNAMSAIHDEIQSVTLQLQIHDELIGQVSMGDMNCLPQVKERMIKAFPHRHLPLDVGLSWSHVSLHDLKEYA